MTESGNTQTGWGPATRGLAKTRTDRGNAKRRPRNRGQLACVCQDLHVLHCV